jgi:hypothetical protein
MAGFYTLGGVIVSAIVFKHRGNLDGVRQEMESTLIDDLADRYEVGRFTITQWEHKLGFYCMRKCKWCKKVLPGDRMIRNAVGALGIRCAEHEYPPYSTPDRWAAAMRANLNKSQRRQLSQMRDTEEFATIPQVLLEYLRKPMSSMVGRWNRYAEGVDCA